MLQPSTSLSLQISYTDPDGATGYKTIGNYINEDGDYGEGSTDVSVVRTFVAALMTATQNTYIDATLIGRGSVNELAPASE